MKLNAAAEMLPLSRPEFMCMHPLVPEDQAEGYRELINNLSEELRDHLEAKPIILRGFNIWLILHFTFNCYDWIVKKKCKIIKRRKRGEN